MAPSRSVTLLITCLHMGFRLGGYRYLNSTPVQAFTIVPHFRASRRYGQEKHRAVSHIGIILLCSILFIATAAGRDLSACGLAGILDSKVEDFQAALASGVTGALVASQQVPLNLLHGPFKPGA